MTRLIQLTLSVLLSGLLCTPASGQFNSGRATVSLSVNNEIYPYREFATYVLPNEHLGLCLQTDDVLDLDIVAGSGTLDYISDCRWIWTAPGQEGLTSLIVNRGNREIMKLNIFVMTPGERLRNGRIGEVEIGPYPTTREDSPLYQRPDGFIRVTEDLLNTPVSPHFVLGQFITPLDDSFPKYIVLRERLLLKLEVLMEKLNELGYEAQSLSVISGYMTPAFNASIGGSPESRHIYGGAATIIVDTNNDGRMDDLNADNIIDRRDGQVLFDIIDELYSEPGKEFLRGGLFLYPDANGRGPMIMLDARGFRRRWTDERDMPPIPENLRPKHIRQFR